MSAAAEKSPKTPKKKKSSHGTTTKKKKSAQKSAAPAAPAPAPVSSPLFSMPEQGLFAALEDSLADMVEQDVVVQWFSSMINNASNTKMIAADQGESNTSTAAAGGGGVAGRLPSSVVGAPTPRPTDGPNPKGLVARVSQNERWMMKWGSGSLLPTDPDPFSTVDLKVDLPLGGVNPATLAASLAAEIGGYEVWGPPLGFDWAPQDEAWRLDVDPHEAVDDEHDAERWTYAVDSWLLVGSGAGSDSGAFVRRRVWERGVVPTSGGGGGGSGGGGASGGAVSSLAAAAGLKEAPKSANNTRSPGNGGGSGGGGGGGGNGGEANEAPLSPGLLRFHVDLSTGAGLGLSPALFVTRVVSGGPAELQGLEVGCKVVKVGGKNVGNLDAFKGAFHECREQGHTKCSIDFKNAADSAADALLEAQKEWEAARGREEAAAAAALAEEDAKVARALKAVKDAESMAAATAQAKGSGGGGGGSGTGSGWEAKGNQGDEGGDGNSSRIPPTKTKKKMSFRKAALAATGLGKKKAK